MQVMQIGHFILPAIRPDLGLWIFALSLACATEHI